jgi:hypothetical protein
LAEQYCIHFNFDSGGMNDMDCNSGYNFICEV